MQFQKGMSLPYFLQEYGTEEQCFDALTPGSTIISDGLPCFYDLSKIIVRLTTVALRTPAMPEKLLRMAYV